MDKQASLAPRPSRSCSGHLPDFRAAHLGAGRGLAQDELAVDPARGSALSPAGSSAEGFD